MRRIKAVRHFKSGDTAVNIVLFLLCLAPIAASLLITTDGMISTLHVLGYSLKLNNVCIFLLATGYKCPVCGMTRGFSYISHDNMAAAWHMSHAVIPLYFLCAFEVIYRLLRLFMNTNSRFVKIFRVTEIVLIVVAGASMAFFFIAQFVDPVLTK